MKLQLRYTFRDYREASRLHRLGGFWSRWGTRAGSLVGALFMFAGTLIFLFTPKEAWRGLFPFLGGGLMVFSATLLPRFMQHHEFSKNSCLQHDSFIDISEESIRFENPTARSEHQWNGIRRWVENEQMFLLYISPRLFMMFPKRTFGPGEADEFRQLLRRKLLAS